mgnify:CR=1 FL=1
MLRMNEIESGYIYHYESPIMSHGSLGHIMGTRFDILIMDKSREETESIWKRIVDELMRLNKMLNRFDPESEVANVNRNAWIHPVKIDDELWSILLDCRKYYHKTCGMFDITLRDFSALALSPLNKNVSFKQKGLYIDLGGYAKGYTLKRLLEILHSYHVDNAFIDFGNSAIYGLGHHPYGDSWKVSISNPYLKGVSVGEFKLTNTALSTSGNTPDYCGHIVNPHSGEKKRGEIIICIESDDPLEAEVLSTTMMASDHLQREYIINKFKSIKMKEFNL